MSFKNLKNKSNDNIKKLGSRIEDEDKGGYARDERYWKPTIGKDNTGSAVIRLMPAPDGEEYPWVTLRKYFVKLKGYKKFYAENSLRTLKQKDPMNEHFFEVRGDGSTQALKDAARPFSETTRYIMNILVIEDPGNPDNEGKTFLYEAPVGIKGKIDSAINPESKAKEAYDPFDLWSGANLFITVKDKSGFANYDSSEFGSRGPVSEDDAELEKIYNGLYSLEAEIAPDKFKSYEELSEILEEFLNSKGGGGASSGKKNPIVPPSKKKAEQEEDEQEDEQDEGEPDSVAADDGDDDDEMARYRKMMRKK